MSNQTQFHRRQDDDPGLNMLLLAVLPLVLWLFQGTVSSMVAAVLHFGLLALGLRLIATGQQATRAYNKAKSASRPPLPRKLIGSGVIGLLVFLLAGQQFASLWLPLLFGLAATGLSVAAFGVDPLEDKGVDDPVEVQKIHNEALLTEAETTLNEICARIDRQDDADLSRRTAAARAMALRVTAAIQHDGDAIEKLRKPLTKYCEILSAEVLRLEAATAGEDYHFARRRYAAKLEVLTESFEDRVTKGGVQTGPDAFDMEADILLERMRHDAAA